MQGRKQLHSRAVRFLTYLHFEQKSRRCPVILYEKMKKTAKIKLLGQLTLIGKIITFWVIHYCTVQYIEGKNIFHHVDFMGIKR
jgi:hypothetical protein